MSTTIKTGWLNDKNGDKFAPKTLTSQVQTNDGVLLEDKIQIEIDTAKAYADSVASGKADKSSIPTKTSQLTNDSGYITSAPDEIYVGDGDMPTDATIQIILDGEDEEQALKDEIKEELQNYIDSAVAEIGGANSAMTEELKEHNTGLKNELQSSINGLAGELSGSIDILAETIMRERLPVNLKSLEFGEYVPASSFTVTDGSSNTITISHNLGEQPDFFYMVCLDENVGASTYTNLCYYFASKISGTSSSGTSYYEGVSFTGVPGTSYGSGGHYFLVTTNGTILKANSIVVKAASSTVAYYFDIKKGRIYRWLAGKFA